MSLQEISTNEMVENHRYFVREGGNFYFATYKGIHGDHIKMFGGYLHDTSYGNMYFHSNYRYFSHTFYKYVPWIRYEWEQYWLNQILQDITGDDTFTYSIMPS
jgi:hypothetical protein